VYAVAVTPDNRFAISGSKDKSIKIIELSTGEIYHDLQDIHEGNKELRSTKFTF